MYTQIIVFEILPLQMMTSPGVEIMPIENFSTEHILGLNLKESLETIQKIGESAAKEYQIEQGKLFNIYIYLCEELSRRILSEPFIAALDKMEREWEHMNLNIHPYRETGTGVIKGENTYSMY